MHLIDTNYLVRLAVSDNQEMKKEVSDFLKKSFQKNEEVFICLVSIFEFIWVLESVYNWKKEEVFEYLDKLLISGLVKFENQEVLIEALINSKKNNLGLEDNYILAYSKIIKLKLHTFDKKMKKLI